VARRKGTEPFASSNRRRVEVEIAEKALSPRKERHLTDKDRLFLRRKQYAIEMGLKYNGVPIAKWCAQNSPWAQRRIIPKLLQENGLNPTSLKPFAARQKRGQGGGRTVRSKRRSRRQRIGARPLVIGGLPGLGKRR
jgi:hypothetical protein